MDAMNNPSPTQPTPTPIDELHVHDWTPWGPSPLDAMAGVERRRRWCHGCDLTQDEPAPFGPVTESAIEAAARADWEGLLPADGLTWETLREEVRDSYRAIHRVSLAAAVPHIRAQIADEIEAEGSKFLVEARRDGYRSAARVARGGEATDG
jgi:hypothetical protein